MILDDYYVLVDTEQKLVIDRIRKLPDNWCNISGLSGLSDQELCDLKWAGHHNLGWISISSKKIKKYHSSSENLEMNKNIFKQLTSEARREKELSGIYYQEIKFKTDEKTRYSLFLKKIYGGHKINYKCFNVYHTFTSEQIDEILTMVENYVQECFDWEKKIYEQIDECKNIFEFSKINI